MATSFSTNGPRHLWSYAFGYLHPTKQRVAAPLPNSDVLPSYRDRQLPVETILSDDSREFCGREMHPYTLYLALNDIDYRRTPIGSSQTNRFVERFIRTVKEEFFEAFLRQTFYDSVATLQADLDTWLVHYNTDRPHLGYRTWAAGPSIPSTCFRNLLRKKVSHGHG